MERRPVGSRARGEGPNASPGLGLTGVRLSANRLGSEPKEFPWPSSGRPAPLISARSAFPKDGGAGARPSGWLRQPSSCDPAVCMGWGQ